MLSLLAFLAKSMGTPYFCAQMVASSMPTGLRRQNDSDLAGVEILGELVRNVLEQTGVDAVVEETVDLDDVAGQDSALAADALLKKLHGITPPEKIISDEIFRLKW